MKKLLLILLILPSIVVYGQQEEQSSLYMYNGLFYNPAYAGSRNTLNIAVAGRYQWVGFDNAPKSVWCSVNSPIKGRNLAIGGHVVSDQIGARKRTSFFADFAGSVQVTKKGGRLSAGISLGADNVVLNYSDLHALDANDQYATTNYSGTKMNTGAGLYYYGPKGYVGISVPRFLHVKETELNPGYTVTSRHMYFSAGRVMKISSTMDLKTSALVKYVSGAPLTADLNASLFLYKRYWVGAMYRMKESVGINAAVVISDRFTVAYAYDFPINGLSGYQSGSHEVCLQIDLSRYSKTGIYSPRYF